MEEESGRRVGEAGTLQAEGTAARAQLPRWGAWQAREEYRPGIARMPVALPLGRRHLGAFKCWWEWGQREGEDDREVTWTVG